MGSSGRPSLLAVGFVIMMFNSIYQYSWNALAPMIEAGLRASFKEVQVAFTLFTTFSVAFQLLGGYIADRRGPRMVSLLASVLSAMGFIGTSGSRNLLEFYAAWSAGSAGEGMLYGIASNIAIKWFRGRRGTAIGLISFGFGAGGALANPLILRAGGFREATLAIGLVELAVLPALAFRIRYPEGLSGVRTEEVIRGASWWLIYASYTLAVVPLLALSSALARLSSMLGIQGAALEAAITLFPLMSGLGRPVLGAVRDALGSLRAIGLCLAAVALGSALIYPLGQVLAGSALVGLFGGALVPIYFSAVGDIYGEAYSTSNTALLYTGKMIAGFLGGVAFAYLMPLGAGASAGFLVLCEALAALLLAAAFLSGKARLRQF